MSSIRYEPYKLFDQFNHEISRLFSNTRPRTAVATSGWSPAVDIREEEDRYVLVADLPGIDREDVDITVEDNILTFKGERNTAKENGSTSFWRRERTHGEFLRQFTLPELADTENIRAAVSSGVLEIEIPKQEKLQPRKIAVN
jgi:HSP20 family protein